MAHPFPDNAVVATRQMERYGIGIGQLEPLIAFAGARYVLQLRWPTALHGPHFRQGPASEYVVGEVDIVVAKVDRPKEPLFTGTGRAEFAWAHKLPALGGAVSALASIEFPWDP